MEITKKSSYTLLKAACYTTNVSMSITGNLSPILFITFYSLYGISYSLLGLLVLINFFTQLIIDLIFSFFSHKFNIPLTVKITPVLTVAGLAVYAIWPFIFPDAVYIGLVIGTVIFSMSSGLAEVLISPVIAAIPSDNPDREMSKLHSIYAWGVVGMIVFATIFLRFIGQDFWQYLALIFALVPLTAAFLYSRVEIPKMETPERVTGALDMMKKPGVWLCVTLIFLGGASECTMAQWCSGFLEKGLGIEKIWGDVFGAALFAMTLGLGRTFYAKYGKSIDKILLCCTCGAVVCYITAALTENPIIGMLACGLTGLATSMLWPGSLIVASDRFPTAGVFIYAIMAAGGDLGASVGPQLVGLITDAAIEIPTLTALAETLSLSPDQLGMKLGLLVGMLFPLVAIPFHVYNVKTKNQSTK